MALKGRKWVSRAKLNRLVWYEMEWISIKKIASQLEDFRKFDVEISDERYDLITSIATKMKGIGKVNIHFAYATYPIFHEVKPFLFFTK